MKCSSRVCWIKCLKCLECPIPWVFECPSSAQVPRKPQWFWVMRALSVFWMPNCLHSGQMNTGCLPQILIGLFLNTLSQISVWYLSGRVHSIYLSSQTLKILNLPYINSHKWSKFLNLQLFDLANINKLWISRVLNFAVEITKLNTITDSTCRPNF